MANVGDSIITPPPNLSMLGNYHVIAMIQYISTSVGRLTIMNCRSQPCLGSGDYLGSYGLFRDAVMVNEAAFAVWLNCVREDAMHSCIFPTPYPWKMEYHICRRYGIFYARGTKLTIS